MIQTNQQPNPSLAKATGLSPNLSAALPRVTGLSKLSPVARRALLVEKGFLTQEEADQIARAGALSETQADGFIENCIGTFELPLGLATNFLIDGTERLVPMAVEESSVIAAASHGAKLIRTGGGFETEPTATWATAQVQFWAPEHLSAKIRQLYDPMRPQLETLARDVLPRLVERGGGLRGLELRDLGPSTESPHERCWVLHLHVDTCEAMGANVVNTLAEEVGRRFTEWLPVRVGLKILTNLATQRLTRVRGRVAFAALKTPDYTGAESARRIVEAYRFADLDPFRAATHNKGVMNGVDSVAIATGNDWRAIEAGCHAWAALQGHYKPLTRWWTDASQGDWLFGEFLAPIAVGTVGGLTRLHPSVRSSLKILGNPKSDVLSGIIGCVGLAQNLSALRALACEGIQRGHMALHEKNLEMMRKYDDLPAIESVPSPYSSRADA